MRLIERWSHWRRKGIIRQVVLTSAKEREVAGLRGGEEEEEAFDELSVKPHQSTHIFKSPGASCLLSDPFFSTLLVIWAFSPMASFIVGPFKIPLEIQFGERKWQDLAYWGMPEYPWKSDMGICEIVKVSSSLPFVIVQEKKHKIFSVLVGAHLDFWSFI